MSDYPATGGGGDNSYQRANGTWHCGRAAEGMPCPQGPTDTGQCGAICTPYLADGRYHCSNSSTLGGQCDEGPLPDGSCCQVPAQCEPTKKAGIWICNRGKCEDGPLPDGSCCQQFGICRPVRGVLAKRKLVVLAAMGLAVAGLLAALAGPTRNSIISPGQLTSRHEATPDQCASCHEAGNGSIHDWVDAAFPPQHDGMSQSGLCLKCHKELGNDAMYAHSFNIQQLAEITKRITSKSHASPEPRLLHAARIGRPASDSQLACATCHHEHRGAHADLSHMTDLQCQVCHTSPFHGFDKGHPEFDSFPYSRRTGLYFDHVAHYGRHFKESARFQSSEDVSHSCRDCHASDETGDSMTVVDFQHSCGSCHDHQIKDASLAGIAFFSLPAIDVQSLVGNQRTIGQWPRIYPQHVQAFGSISPLTRLLLDENDDFARLADELEGLDLSDLREADPDQLQQVEEFVWAVKRALHQLESEGRRGLRRRLSTALHVEATERDVGLLYEKVIDARNRWLPNLEAEVAAHAEGNAADLSQSEERKPIPENLPQWVEQQRARIARIDVGWYVSDSDLSVRYRPTDHADSWLVAWLDASFRLGGPSTDPRLAESLRSVFATLSSPTAPGRCMKCHTADGHERGEPRIHWTPNKPVAGGFTKFDHRPHLTILNDDQACSGCHRMKDPADFQAGDELFRSQFIHANWSINTAHDHFEADFKPLKVSDCAECHHSERTSHSCLTCHNYHIHDRR